MKHLTILLILLAQVCHGADIQSFFQSSEAFFKKYVRGGFVNYAQLKANQGDIEARYQDINAAKLDGLSMQVKKAFYINAYNLIVIYWIVKHYPLKSPLDDSGFFDKVKHRVAGEEMTLNVLEIKKLLQPYQDPRIHFALSCAAKSCPPLADFAFTPQNLEQALTARTTKSVNDDTWLMVDDKTRSVKLSKIFEWYNKDFTASGTTVVKWINQYRKTAIPETYWVSYYEYDWALNDRK